MENTINFKVTGKPVSKSNSYRIGNKRMYKTKACVAWEKKVSEEALTAMRKAEAVMADGPVEMEVKVVFPDNRRRDLDNVLKSILDAMNGIVYKDDCQVQKLILSKTVEAGYPRVELHISW